MWLLTVVCCVLPVLFCAAETPTFRDDYKFDSASQAFYKEHPPSAWSEAVRQCAAEGAQLAAPRTEAQRRALARHMGAETPSVWVGMSDRLARGFYLTLDGFSASEIFMKWVKDKPSNYRDDENCIQMDRAELYQDMECTLVLHFVCKKGLSKDENSARPFFRRDYTYESAFAAFYKGHREVSTWHEAVSTCVAEGASLAVPTSEGERGLLKDLTWGADLWAWSIWLGISDINSEGKFVLLNGLAAPDSILNWSPNQPDNHQDNEDCVEMHFSGVNNDYVCKERKRFVCKKSLSTLSRENSLCGTYDPDYLYSYTTDRCFKLHLTPRSWHDALKTCLAEQAQLGFVESGAEADIYKALVQKKSPLIVPTPYDSKILHLGFTDLLSPGEFKTLSGGNVDEWIPNQPGNSTLNLGKEHCGSMVIEDARLKDINCQTLALFVCEKTLNR